MNKNKFGKFDFSSLVGKDIRTLTEIYESKEEELSEKQDKKTQLIGKILFMQNEIDQC